MTLTHAQTALLRDCERWGEIGPDAEDIAGCHGAAFNAVVDALIRKGYLTDDGRIADLAQRNRARHKWLTA